MAENDGFTLDTNSLNNGSQTKFLTTVTKACSQRRKSFTRSDAICTPYIDLDGSQTSIDIIDYVHNNKKEKITVIVNLLSDDMLSNRQHEPNAHSAGKINQGNANVKDDLLTIAG